MIRTHQAINAHHGDRQTARDSVSQVELRRLTARDSVSQLELRRLTAKDSVSQVAAFHETCKYDAE